MIKRILSVVLAMLMLCASVAMAEGAAHTHTPLEAWERDLANHWHNCECGEALEAEAHVGGDEDFFTCEVCGSEVWNYGDGSGSVTDYSEFGDILRYSSYDEEGLLTDESVYDIEYDENGERVREATYWNGSLFEEIEYVMGEDEYYIPAVRKNYDEDGCWSLHEYDENGYLSHSVYYDADNAVTEEETFEYDEYGNLLHSIMCDKDGVMLREETNEYTYDEDGNQIGCRNVIRSGDNSSMVNETNEYGDDVLSAFYDVNNELEAGWIYEYEYDEEGRRTWAKQYDMASGRLMDHSEYAIYEDEFGEHHYEKSSTYYEEDGSITVYEYNIHGYEVSAVTRDADGKIVYTRRGEFEYDENDVLVMERYYENDRLIQIVENAVEETEEWICCYQKSRTEINEDGTMYIWEYDVDGNEVSYGLYDAEGNLIPEEASDEE